MNEDRCFTAACPTCGGIIAASVDSKDNRKEAAREVADWVRRGFAVTTTTAEAARAGTWCECRRGVEKRPAVQPNML